MVVVLARAVTGDRTELLVAPVTHREPPRDEGIPIPESVNYHLGLDADPSWIVVAELNRFTWPGPDIRPAKGSDNPLYGAIPAKLFQQVKQGISSHAQARRLQTPKRTE